QAIGTLTLNLAQTMRTHGISFTLALCVGCASTWLWRFANALTPRWLAALDTAPRDPGGTSWSSGTLEGFLTLHASQTLLTALVFLSVWLVTRIHRAHQRAVLVAFVLALTVPQLPGITRLALDAMVSPGGLSLLVPVIVRASLQAVFTLTA